MKVWSSAVIVMLGLGAGGAVHAGTANSFSELTQEKSQFFYENILIYRQRYANFISVARGKASPSVKVTYLEGIITRSDASLRDADLTFAVRAKGQLFLSQLRAKVKAKQFEQAAVALEQNPDTALLRN